MLVEMRIFPPFCCAIQHLDPIVLRQSAIDQFGCMLTSGLKVVQHCSKTTSPVVSNIHVNVLNTRLDF